MRCIRSIALLLFTFVFCGAIWVRAPHEKAISPSSAAITVALPAAADENAGSGVEDGEQWVTTTCGSNMAERHRKAEAARQQAIQSLLADAKQLISKRYYREARKVVTQMLVIAPNEPRALRIQHSMDLLLFVDGYVSISQRPPLPGWPQLRQIP